MTTSRCVFFQYSIFIYMVMLSSFCFCSYSNDHQDDSRNTKALTIIASSSYHANTSMSAIQQDDSEKNNVFLNTTESDDVFINTTESDDVFINTTESDDVFINTTESDNVFINTTESDDVFINTNENDDVFINTTESDDVFINTAESDDVFINTTESDDVFINTTESDDVFINTTESDDVFINTTESDDVFINTTESDDVFINTTESDDVFIHTTESDNIFNNSLSQPTDANNLNYTRDNISQTESAESFQGVISYVETHPNKLSTSTEVGDSDSFDNSVTPDTKRKASKTEHRQPLETPDVRYAIKHWATKFSRNHLHDTRLFQHHLQLMPMNDAAFDLDLFKDHRYVLSVLVPICVVAIGAAMIMATVFSLRYIARRRAVREFQLSDESSMEKQTQSISRISSEQTDRMLLLSVEDDDDM